VATIFEGAGVIPLMLVLVGLIRLMSVTPILFLIARADIVCRHTFDFPNSNKMRKAIVLLRIIFFVGIGLLISGSSLIGNYKDLSSVTLGLKLAKAGYIVLVFIVALIAASSAALSLKWNSLSTDSHQVCFLHSIS
jgi:uncharacterized membrane protein